MSGCCAPKGATRKLSGYDNFLAKGPNSPSVANGVPSVISAMLYFDELPSDAAITELAREFYSFDALSSRPQSGWWVPQPFNRDHHVHAAQAEGEAGLLAFATQKLCEPLKHSADGAPRWELWVVTNTGAGRQMLFVRVDHCCADGIALVQVLNRIARRADGRPLAPASYTRPPRPKQSAGAACCDALAGLGKNLALPVGGYDAQLAISAPADARKAGVAYPPGGRRKIVVVPEHSLNLLKRIKNAASAAEGAAVSINDVVFAAAAGAIRRHTHQTAAEAAVDGARVHALVPVAFPRAADAPLTNKWTFVQAAMPVGLRTPAERLSASHSAFAKIKGSLDAPMAALLVAANAKLPQAIGQQVGRDLFSRHSIVFSNVPGPAEPIVIGGKTLVGLQAAYPNLIPQLICVSYNQRMHMNIVVDETVVPQPELLASLYIDELRALAVRFGVDPDDASPAPPRPPPASATPPSGTTPLLSAQTPPTTSTSPSARRGGGGIAMH